MAVLNADDGRVAAMAGMTSARVLWFGLAGDRLPSVSASVLACACLLLFSTATAATAATAQSSGPPALSKTEQRIRDYVRAHEPEQVAFLEKAVNISSGVLTPAVRRS